MVTLIPRLPLSANNCAFVVSNSRQSLLLMAAWIPSWMECGVASHIRRLRGALSSSLHKAQFSISKRPLKQRLTTNDDNIKQITQKKNQTYLYVKFSVWRRVPISWTMAKNCWWPSALSCFSSTSMKWWLKQDCIITQSTAPGKLISVAKNTMSSPIHATHAF